MKYITWKCEETRGRSISRFHGHWEFFTKYPDYEDVAHLWSSGIEILLVKVKDKDNDNWFESVNIKET